MSLALISLILAQAAQVPVSGQQTVDPLAAFPGSWQMVNTGTKEVVQDCARAQSFEVTPDRRTLILTEKWANNWTARYRVIHSEPQRVLVFLENETRKTEAGDPALWWAYFDGPDKFRWRRYDWALDSGTLTEWQRCPAP